MDNDEIIKIAMQQQAIDYNCMPEDFCSNENKVVISKENPKARAYLKLPFFCALTSCGGNPEDVVLLHEFFISHIDLQRSVLYIPIAMEATVFSYDECFEWFKKTYQPYGIKQIDICTDLTSVQDIHQYTAVFIGGGNTFKLLKEIKNSSFDEKLSEYLNNDGFVYGGSAGAIIFGKSIKIAEYSDINNVDLIDLSGINLVDGKDIFCHYSYKDNEFIKNYNNDLYVLYEESGLFIQDNKIESIGKPYLNKSDIV